MEMLKEPAALAALVAAVVSSVVVGLFRFMDRPRPYWIVTGYGGGRDLLVTIDGTEQEASKVIVDLVNAGNGTAYGVLLGAVGGGALKQPEPAMSENEGPFYGHVVPVWEPGMRRRVTMSARVEDAESASIAVQWTQPPSFPRRVRRAQYPMRQFQNLAHGIGFAPRRQHRLWWHEHLPLRSSRERSRL